jgi:hypothetical protein
MDGVTLVHRARNAGLRLEVAGNALNITGSKEAEPFVRLLAKHKAQVLEALTKSGLRELRELRKLAPESLQGNLPQSVEEEARRNRQHGDAPYASALAQVRAYLACIRCRSNQRPTMTDWHASITPG